MKKILTTPLKEEELRQLHAGDIIYLTGTLTTGRDDVHRRVVQEGMTSPYDFRDGAIFHAGPIVKETPEENVLIAVGPTSSIRMEADAADFIRLTGLKMMIGKGSMGPKTTAACRQYGCIHCVSVGGTAVSTAEQVEKIEGCFWRELGMPECEWVLQVKEFGPLIVSIDTHGRNLFAENKEQCLRRKAACVEPIVDAVKNYMIVD